MGPAGRGEHRNKRAAGIAEQMRLQASRRLKRPKIASRSKSRASPTHNHPAGRLRPTDAESYRKPRRRHLRPVCHLHSSSSAERQNSLNSCPATNAATPAPSFQPCPIHPSDVAILHASAPKSRRNSGFSGAKRRIRALGTPGISHRERPGCRQLVSAMHRKPRKNRMNDTVSPLVLWRFAAFSGYCSITASAPRSDGWRNEILP